MSALLINANFGAHLGVHKNNAEVGVDVLPRVFRPSQNANWPINQKPYAFVIRHTQANAVNY